MGNIVFRECRASLVIGARCSHHPWSECDARSCSLCCAHCRGRSQIPTCLSPTQETGHFAVNTYPGDISYKHQQIGRPRQINRIPCSLLRPCAPCHISRTKNLVPLVHVSFRMHDQLLIHAIRDPRHETDGQVPDRSCLQRREGAEDLGRTAQV